MKAKILLNLLNEADPSLQPPKEWMTKMRKKVSGTDPDAIIGNIWYNDLTDAKRREIRKRYGKTYGPAKG